MERILSRAEFREALFLVAPGLEERLAKWRRDPDSRVGQKIERPLVEYSTRAASRPTPFGLFAGCSVGTLGARTVLTAARRAGYVRHTRLDMDYVRRFSQAPLALKSQGNTKRMTRSPSQGTGADSSSKPASFRTGLCVRLSKQTVISRLVMSMLPCVLMNRRKIVWGVA